MAYSRKIIGKNRNLSRTRKGGTPSLDLTVQGNAVPYKASSRPATSPVADTVAETRKEAARQERIKATEAKKEPRISHGKFNTLILEFDNETDVENYLNQFDVLDKLNNLKKHSKVDIKTIVLYINSDSKKDFNDKIKKRILYLNQMAISKKMWINYENVEIPPPENIFERTSYYLDGYPAIIINVDNQKTYTPVSHGGKFGFLKYKVKDGKEKLLCIERVKGNMISGFGGAPNVDEAENPKKTVIREMMEELFDKMYIGSPSNNDKIYYKTILETIGIQNELNESLKDVIERQIWNSTLR